MRKTVQICESISEWTGHIVMWFGLALVLLLTWEVFMRYILQSPTIYSYEYATMLGVAIGAGGMGFTHKYNGHVRVDVFWRLLSPRGRAISDAITSVIFFFPFIIIIGVISSEWALRAFVEGEILTKTYLYPPAWPIRTVMALGFFLFVPQGIAKLIRDLHFWIKKEEL
jgi:TRAP-type mannitol/chloroaromatic compound transport system permease small subunit